MFDFVFFLACYIMLFLPVICLCLFHLICSLCSIFIWLVRWMFSCLFSICLFDWLDGPLVLFDIRLLYNNKCVYLSISLFCCFHSYLFLFIYLLVCLFLCLGGCFCMFVFVCFISLYTNVLLVIFCICLVTHFVCVHLINLVFVVVWFVIYLFG